MDQFYPKFLEVWQNVMWIAFFSLISAGVIILLYHLIRTKSHADLKERYDYLNQNEIKMLNWSVACFAAAITAFINTAYPDTVSENIGWWAGRLFISLCAFMLIYYIAYLLFKFSYPAKLYKKLKKLRYSPRYSPDGNEMKLLSEEEEDVHLAPGMQAEEEVFSLDYDVWVDETTGYVKIEKYPGHLVALQCNSCGFQTMKVVNEEIITHPTYDSTGQLIKNYECLYCGSKRKKQFRIAKIVESDENYRVPENPFYTPDKKVNSIRIEIVNSEGIAKTYEFETVAQAQEFMAEMVRDKKQGMV